MAFVQVETPPPVAADAKGAPESQVTAAAAETAGTTPRLSVVVGSLVAILLAWVVSGALNRWSRPAALVVPAGIGLFAMLYAVTQGLERLLEPVSAFFYGTKELTANRDAALATAVNVQASTGPELASRLPQLEAVLNSVQTTRNWLNNPTAASAKRLRDQIAALFRALREESPQDHDRTGRSDPPNGEATTPAKPTNPVPVGADEQRVRDIRALAERDPKAAATRVATELVAVAQAELNQRRADKAIVYWALASVLGILLSGLLGLYLLHIIGLKGDGITSQGADQGGVWTAAGWTWASARHLLDLLVTGLAIGGGTKPLHDLIGNLQEAKNDKKDPGGVS
jgi:hypothetical protein